MITNNDILKWLDFICNKQQASSYSPSELNTNLPIATLRHFKKKVGIPEQYQPGQPIPKEQFEITQKITDDLMVFKVFMGKTGTTPLQIDSDGYAITPTDLYYPSTLDYIEFDNSCPGIPRVRPIDVVTDAQWSARISSPRKYPTYRNPICNFQSGFIRFSPVDLQAINFIYLRFPTRPVYDYYIKANGEYVYLLPGTSHTLLAGEEGSAGQTTGTVNSLSVEIEFDDTNKIDISFTLLADKGINIQESFLTQYAELLKNRGV